MRLEIRLANGSGNTSGTPAGKKKHEEGLICTAFVVTEFNTRVFNSSGPHFIRSLNFCPSYNGASWTCRTNHPPGFGYGPAAQSKECMRCDTKRSFGIRLPPRELLLPSDRGYWRPGYSRNDRRELRVVQMRASDFSGVGSRDACPSISKLQNGLG